jgi:hypothetical protein
LIDAGLERVNPEEKGRNDRLLPSVPPFVFEG